MGGTGVRETALSHSALTEPNAELGLGSLGGTAAAASAEGASAAEPEVGASGGERCTGAGWASSDNDATAEGAEDDAEDDEDAEDAEEEDAEEEDEDAADNVTGCALCAPVLALMSDCSIFSFSRRTISSQSTFSFAPIRTLSSITASSTSAESESSSAAGSCFPAPRLPLTCLLPLPCLPLLPSTSNVCQSPAPPPKPPPPVPRLRPLCEAGTSNSAALTSANEATYKCRIFNNIQRTTATITSAATHNNKAI